MNGTPFSLAGQVALVSGASRGIGAAIAIALAEAGADLALLARSGDGLRETADAVRRRGRRALDLAADVTDIATLPALVAQAESELGPVVILVCNAGGNTPQPFLQVTPEAYDRIMNLNLRSAFFLAQAAAAGMVRRNYGRILFISSQLALVGQPGRSVYSAAKGALTALTRTMALELAAEGVTVNAVAPTVIETSATRGLLAEESYRAEVMRRLPVGRFGQPADVAAAVLYLASPAAGLVTGQTLAVDGGWTAQ